MPYPNYTEAWWQEGMTQKVAHDEGPEDDNNQFFKPRPGDNYNTTDPYRVAPGFIHELDGEYPHFVEKVNHMRQNGTPVESAIFQVTNHTVDDHWKKYLSSPLGEAPTTIIENQLGASTEEMVMYISIGAGGLSFIIGGLYWLANKIRRSRENTRNMDGVGVNTRNIVRRNSSATV